MRDLTTGAKAQLRLLSGGRNGTKKRTRKQNDLSRNEVRNLWAGQFTEAERARLRESSERASDDAKEEKRVTFAEAVQWPEEHLFGRNSVVFECQVWQGALGRARGEGFSVSELKDSLDVERRDGTERMAECLPSRDRAQMGARWQHPTTVDFPCLRPGRAGAEWSAVATGRDRGRGRPLGDKPYRSGHCSRRGGLGCDMMPMNSSVSGGDSLAWPSARRLEFPDHSPGAVSLSAFDDLEGSLTVKRRFRLLQPLADGLGLRHVR
jgi:hypothetical protein